MAFSPENRQGTISGIIFVAIFAAAATAIAKIDFIHNLGISPLVIGIVLGIFMQIHSTTISQLHGAQELHFLVKRFFVLPLLFMVFVLHFNRLWKLV